MQGQAKNGRIKYYEIYRIIYQKIIALFVKAAFLSAGDPDDVPDLQLLIPGRGSVCTAEPQGKP